MKPGTMNQEPGIEVKITIFVKKNKARTKLNRKFFIGNFCKRNKAESCNSRLNQS